MTEAPYVETAVYGMLTRAYLRSGKLEDAERAYRRMSELFEQHSRDASRTLQSAVARVRGFYLVSRGAWKEADAVYTASIPLLKAAPGGMIHEAETRREYASWLQAQHGYDEARAQLEAARSLYESLENKSGLVTVQALVNQLPSS